MRLGFHLSISGGLDKALERGKLLGCETGQIFSRNPRGWASKPILPDVAAEFRRKRKQTGLHPLAIHMPYLANPASSDRDLRQRSVMSLIEEMQRGRMLDADYVVIHPGHVRKGDDVNKALDLAADAILEALIAFGAARPMLLLETTAGRQGELGARFEELSGIIKKVESDDRLDVPLGVCLDTAHIWSAGYDLAGLKGPDRALTEFDRVIGLDRLKFLHLNDSKYGLGQRQDRHAVVGQGYIGSRGLAALVRHPALTGLAGIMETPITGEEEDRATLKRVKRWRRG